MKNNVKIASLVFCFFSCMFLLAFASVPLYNLFCKVTGYGGTPQASELPSSYISDKKIKVRFNADVSNKLKLYFQPVDREIITKIGKSNTVNYEVINNTGKDILITSTYNVTPQKAGLYFNKLDCFCYEERKVLAGQKILLPVTFFISPDIIDDPNTSELKSLTLSYTFFNVNNINVSNLY